MGGKSSLEKGKNGEREVVKLLQPIVNRVCQEFEECDVARLQRNTLQSDNGGFDIVGIDWLALEVKRQEQLNINSWWMQTLAQTKTGQHPVLFFRQSRQQWRVMTLVPLRLDECSAPLQVRGEITLEAFLQFFERKLRAELWNKGYVLRPQAQKRPSAR